jgi:hypothetical protein
LLSAEYILKASAEQLALTIVHEATHARLWARGFDYRHECRRRIEERCVKEEVDFALRLPDGVQLADEAKAKLGDPWWTEGREFERRVRQLQELDRPSWYIRLYRALYQPR